MVKKEYFTKVINWARKKGITGIKANHEDFDQPTQFRKNDVEKPFVPDVTGRKLDKKIYIEIATKTEDVPREVSKWKLLSSLAMAKGGKLFLMIPRGNKAFTERVLKKYNINNAQLVYMPNI